VRWSSSTLTAARVIVGVDEVLARRPGELAGERSLCGDDTVHLADALVLGPRGTILATWDRDSVMTRLAPALRLRPRSGLGRVALRPRRGPCRTRKGRKRPMGRFDRSGSPASWTAEDRSICRHFRGGNGPTLDSGARRPFRVPGIPARRTLHPQPENHATMRESGTSDGETRTRTGDTTIFRQLHATLERPRKSCKNTASSHTGPEPRSPQVA
jgi:hypothetical protein